MEGLQGKVKAFISDPDTWDQLRLRQEVRRAMNDRGGVIVPYKKGGGT